MSKTKRKLIKPNHAKRRFNCQMEQSEYDALECVAIDTKLPMSWHAREAINKYVKVHKYAKKEVE